MIYRIPRIHWNSILFMKTLWFIKILEFTEFNESFAKFCSTDNKQSKFLTDNIFAFQWLKEKA